MILTRRHVLMLAATPALMSLVAPARGQSAERLQVVATFSILGDIVRNLTGDAADVTVIVGRDGDAHTFEPNPAQIGAIADADLIIENGIGFEPWLDDMYEASGSSATRVIATDGLTLLALGADDAESGEEHTSDDGHDHGDHDPHVWHDVSNVVHEVGVIRDALATADPANAGTYTGSADAYSAQLTDLDTRIRAMVESVPAEHRVLVTSHDSLGYFAHAYGFTIAGSAFGSLSTEAADPSAGEIADLIEQIKATGVPAIFAENVENSELMEQIARDAGVSLAPTLFTDALSAEEGDAPTYISLMIWNATTIVTALGGSAG